MSHLYTSAMPILGLWGHKGTILLPPAHYTIGSGIYDSKKASMDFDVRQSRLVLKPLRLEFSIMAGHYGHKAPAISPLVDMNDKRAEVGSLPGHWTLLYLLGEQLRALHPDRPAGAHRIFQIGAGKISQPANSGYQHTLCRRFLGLENVPLIHHKTRSDALACRAFVPDAVRRKRSDFESLGHSHVPDVRLDRSERKAGAYGRL
jgi:hypothetical protein